VLRRSQNSQTLGTNTTNDPDLLEYIYDLANVSIQSLSLSPAWSIIPFRKTKNPKLNADVVLVSISFKGARRLKKISTALFSGEVHLLRRFSGQPVFHLIYYREIINGKWKSRRGW
jgi:hypothetical protein